MSEIKYIWQVRIWQIEHKYILLYHILAARLLGIELIVGVWELEEFVPGDNTPE